MRILTCMADIISIKVERARRAATALTQTPASKNNAQVLSRLNITPRDKPPAPAKHNGFTEVTLFPGPRTAMLPPPNGNKDGR